jgi:hypothetical protein
MAGLNNVNGNGIPIIGSYLWIARVAAKDFEYE